MIIDPVRLRTLPRRAAQTSATVALHPVRVGWRRLVLRRGRDATAYVARRSCLVIATHPGDEILACGAAIARRRGRGTPVEIVFVTDGRHLHRSRYLRAGDLAAMRRHEATTASAMLGVPTDSVHFLGFEASALARCQEELVEALAGVLRTVFGGRDTDDVLMPYGLDRDPDRRAVREASVLACARVGTEARITAYPVSLWAEGPAGHLPAYEADVGDESLQYAAPPPLVGSPPRAELVSTECYLFLKRAAWERYSSLVSNLTGEIDWPRANVVYAESFMGPAEVFFPPERPSGAGRRTTRRLVGAMPVHSGEDAQDTGAQDPGGQDPGAQDPGAQDTVTVATPIRDEFVDDRLAGAVVGSVTPAGLLRRGIDVENSIAVDGGQLRLGHLDTPGWQRQGVSYGPFARRPGLALAVRALNSHHNANFRASAESGRVAALSRLARDISQGQLLPADLDDNLVIGFHRSAAPADPRSSGHSFAMHAAGVVNGELRARSGEGYVRVHRGVQEVPFDYVVVLRPHGAIYYVASLPRAAGATGPSSPTSNDLATSNDVNGASVRSGDAHLRPVAIDAHGDGDALVYAGIHQSVHGETGHRLSTRIGEVRVAEVAAYQAWYTSALEADALTGGDLFDRSKAERGATWSVTDGVFRRTATGLSADDGGATALVALDEAAGLVAVVLRTAAVVGDEGFAGLLWRADPLGHQGWRVRLWHDRAELAVGSAATWTVVAEDAVHLPAASECSLQVLDDGHAMAVHLDGTLLFGRMFSDDRHREGQSVGLTSGPGGRCQLAWFEAHGRSVPTPPELDLGPLWCEQGTELVVEDEFAGEPGELASRARLGAPAWRRTLGVGRLDLTGERGARVRADRQSPNPGRTLYTFDWPDESLADLEVTIEPPGSARSQGHSSRAGLTFGEDNETYLVVNVWLDDSPHHDGSAVSLFYCYRGVEEQLNAVWTNVGRRISWGQPSRLRAVCDGRQILVWLDGEPVLYRRTDDIYPGTQPFVVRRVGLAVNREWGDDTGSTFRHVIARRRP